MDTPEEKSTKKVKTHYREKKSWTIQKQVQKNMRPNSQRSLESVPSESESETKAIPLLYLLFMPNHSSLPIKHRQGGVGEKRERKKGS